ncbi:hypothetical protein M2323_000771 [Rhodoblastus acidophilus]|uniref:hypothetical protein n=1 Tax=Rhodoblastus acidophilus TaxID=1074 RepID=UPI0022250F92|nr:hypothetical protein [Rhodoblastus acidophilus]MCW2283082.1 hypothetical protein [Rhodoblastus acidophilus]MCW2331867.1 hypothetical protein [Rhodoblastus acidophilus]
MSGRIVHLADYILDDLRMIPRACDLLDRVSANADAFYGERDTLPPALGCAWEPLMRAAVDFCERLAARYNGLVLEEDFEDLDLLDVVFDDEDIAVLKIFARDPACARVAPDALDIVRQCRHIQALLHAENARAAA